VFAFFLSPCFAFLPPPTVVEANPHIASTNPFGAFARAQDATSVLLLSLMPRKSSETKLKIWVSNLKQVKYSQNCATDYALRVFFSDLASVINKPLS